MENKKWLLIYEEVNDVKTCYAPSYLRTRCATITADSALEALKNNPMNYLGKLKIVEITKLVSDIKNNCSLLGLFEQLEKLNQFYTDFADTWDLSVSQDKLLNKLRELGISVTDATFYELEKFSREWEKMYNENRKWYLCLGQNCQSGESVRADSRADAHDRVPVAEIVLELTDLVRGEWVTCFDSSVYEHFKNLVNKYKNGLYKLYDSNSHRHSTTVAEYEQLVKEWNDRFEQGNLEQVLNYYEEADETRIAAELKDKEHDVDEKLSDVIDKREKFKQECIKRAAESKEQPVIGKHIAIYKGSASLGTFFSRKCEITDAVCVNLSMQIELSPLDYTYGKNVDNVGLFDRKLVATVVERQTMLKKNTVESIRVLNYTKYVANLIDKIKDIKEINLYDYFNEISDGLVDKPRSAEEQQFFDEWSEELHE